MDIDKTRPQIGRIYDYVLGGHHNYEVDRAAAAQMLEVFPAYPRWARINRWFLQYVAEKWAEEGRKRVLDIASGLPTQGHFNDFLNEARVLFSDVDPLSVAYGEQLLKDRPNMRYVLADARSADPLLTQASEFFSGEHEVAIGAIGIAYFLEDDDLHRLLQALHDWSAPGSVLAVSFIAPVEGASTAMIDAINATGSRVAGIRIHPRTPAHFAEVAAPWRVTRVGPVHEWLEVPDMFSAAELFEGGAYLGGAFLER